MAWDSYHGRHRIVVHPVSTSSSDPEKFRRCLAVDLHKKGSPYKNIIAHVCETQAGKWKHSSGASRRTIYGPFKTARAAIKDAVDAWGAWIGVHRTMDGARSRRRRRRR